MKLQEHLEAAANDYTALEDLYRAQTGSELVLDPFASFQVELPLDRTATVLIGSHDSRSTLRRSLESIAASSFNVRHPDLLEVVVVDDGSTDGTWEMLGSLDVDLRLHCIRQERAGLNRAHNTGLAFASGDVVVFSDADVIHTPFAIEELMKRHQVLPGVTLVGFRFDVDSADVDPSQLVPAFWNDFRVTFPGVPTSICRETDHLKELGHKRRLAMANGARYDLSSTVVGAFFSIERETLLAMGGSEEQLRGWGCEDSLIGARAIALAKLVVPVYAATVAHVAHTTRDTGQAGEFARNIQSAVAILEEEFAPPGGADLAAFATRALGHLEGVRSYATPDVRTLPGYPFHVADYAVRGLYAWALGRFSEAADSYAAAAEQDPDSAWPFLGRAKALREAGDHDAALDAFGEARRRDPGNAWVAWEEGLAHAAHGDHRRAGAAIGEAHTYAPDQFEAAWSLRLGADGHKRRGNEHAAQSLHRIALRDFDLSLALGPELPWTHFDRGLSLREFGQLDEAKAAVRRADELLHPQDGNRTWIHLALGELHLATGEQASAKLELERSLRFHPGNARAAEVSARLTHDAESAAGIVCTLPLLEGIAAIPGWLSDGEADLLSASVVRAVPLAIAKHAGILELGSFFGRSTVLIAETLRRLGTAIPFTAVDPHKEYEFGGVPDTYQAFLANLRQHGVEHLVRVVRGLSHELEWDAPLALLFIDALHDYDSVRRDHELFDRFVVPGGLIAFHDYFDYCPGVVQHVDEVLASGALELAGHRDRLIVLRRRQQATMHRRQVHRRSAVARA
jgi:tetratricopeptide (TPR) repeat protein